MTPKKSIDPGVRIDHVPLKGADIAGWIGTSLTKVAVFVLVMLFGFSSLDARSPTPLGKSAQTTSKLLIDKSSSSVSFGKVYLTVGPLTYKNHLYLGDYKLSVVPYFTMSEKGVLALDAPDDVMQKLLEGVATAFTGKASNNKQGKPKMINGKIMPSTKTHGSVTFSVQTDNGPAVFNTSYHFGE